MHLQVQSLVRSQCDTTSWALDYVFLQTLYLIFFPPRLRFSRGDCAMFPSLRHWCLHNCDWLNVYFPCSRAVAVATENSPESQVPACTTMLTRISDSVVFSIAAICFFTNNYVDWWMQTITSAPPLAPMPVSKAIMNDLSSDTIWKPIDWIKQGSCRPALALHCSHNKICAAEISEVFSYPTRLSGIWRYSFSSVKCLLDSHVCISCGGSTLIGWSGFL